MKDGEKKSEKNATIKFKKKGKKNPVTPRARET
jgi:hypothetical protein